MHDGAISPEECVTTFHLNFLDLKSSFYKTKVVVNEKEARRQDNSQRVKSE